MEKRLFIGIKILPSEKLIDIYQELRSKFENERIKWIPFENMHITLNFIGNTHEENIPQINLIIKESSIHFKPFGFDIKGLGYFKKNKKIHVIWMGIENGKELDSFAHSLIENLQLIGFENETRNYNAHLTLGRINSISDEKQFLRIISDYQDVLIQNISVKEITLFESVQRPEGSFYKVIEYFPLIQG
jgi:2'-5' RNA ligase